MLGFIVSICASTLQAITDSAELIDQYLHYVDQLQVANQKEAIMKDAKLNTTWADTTVRCTSFAVKVVSPLEKQSSGTFKFDIYDLGRHRVARCEKTGILIDSSSKNGAFPLPEGEWVRIEGSEASWKWIKGKSKFERNVGTSGIVSCFPLAQPELVLSSIPKPAFSPLDSLAYSPRFFFVLRILPDFIQYYSTSIRKSRKQ